MRCFAQQDDSCITETIEGVGKIRRVGGRQDLGSIPQFSDQRGPLGHHPVVGGHPFSRLGHGALSGTLVIGVFGRFTGTAGPVGSGAQSLDWVTG